MLEQKADVTDLDKICGILEGKVDRSKFEELAVDLKQIPQLVDRSEF